MIARLLTRARELLAAPQNCCQCGDMGCPSLVVEVPREVLWGLLAEVDRLRELSCTCTWTPEALWTTHYGSVEPGSQRDYDPNCPIHHSAGAPLISASQRITELLAEVERMRERLADVEALHSSFPLYTVHCEHDEDCNCIELSNGEYYEPDHHEPACETCSGDMDCCDASEHMTPWPCPTVMAARGEPR